MGVQVLGGQLQGCNLTVGADVEARRGDESLGKSVIVGVKVGNKLLDVGKDGEFIEVVIRGPLGAQVQVGDTLHFS